MGKKKAFVIGIAGGSASGKTTFCNELENRFSKFKVKAVHMDQYFKSEEQRPFVEAPVTGIKYMDDNHPTTMDLPQLRIDLKEIVDSKEFEIIIVEGLLTLWDNEICAMLDLKLFVDCQADERIVRRLRRNMGFGLEFDEIAAVYLDMVRYRHNEYVEPTKWRADIIINGSSKSEKAIEMIAKYAVETQFAE